ncbi:MAG TPA: hypothetical protein VKP30_28205 [Polyangiaceae bacterium]|nr:hypothetical protein [Polyangiaceae bacterium]
MREASRELGVAVCGKAVTDHQPQGQQLPAIAGRKPTSWCGHSFCPYSSPESPSLVVALFESTSLMILSVGDAPRAA